MQAWLTRAVILTVRARYDEARASCGHVASSPLAFVVCASQIDSLTGHAREAHERLASVMGQEAVSRDEQEWALSSLGEYAARFGDVPLAERHFREALAIAPEDAYVRGALADLLIDASRPGEAIELLRGREADDGMLLRLAIAGKDADHAKMLASRFDASRARGDAVHRREEARFALLLGERERALTLARANWDVQKEPWDVRVLLAAAIAAAEAAPALEHLERTKLEDPAIRTLAARLK